MKESTQRVVYVDGIKGIASLLVVFCHLACTFLPNLYMPGFVGGSANRVELLFYNSPLNVITNGNIAVQCFFILSGFLIARKVYIKKRDGLISPIKIYANFLRVVIPGVLIAFVLMKFNLMFHLKAAEINPLLCFVNDYNNFDASFFGAVKDAFLKTFISGSSFVGPFWTIRYEIIGSIMVYALSCYSLEKPRIAKVLFVMVGILLMFRDINYVAFLVGAFVFVCGNDFSKDDEVPQTRGFDKVIEHVLNNKTLLILLLLLGAYLASVNESTGVFYYPIRKFISVFDSITSYKLSIILFRQLGIGLMLLCVSKISAIQKLLSNKVLTWLGRISPYTYALHWPLILSIGCGIYLLIYNKLSYGLCVMLISIIVIAVTLVSAFATNKLVKVYIKMQNKVKELVVRKITTVVKKNRL